GIVLLINSSSDSVGSAEGVCPSAALSFEGGIRSSNGLCGGASGADVGSTAAFGSGAAAAVVIGRGAGGGSRRIHMTAATTTPIVSTRPSAAIDADDAVGVFSASAVSMVDCGRTCSIACPQRQVATVAGTRRPHFGHTVLNDDDDPFTGS